MSSTENDPIVKPDNTHVTDAPAGDDVKPLNTHVTDVNGGTETTPDNTHVTSEPN
ncbi:hypothetical protein [Streptomyces hygroscopicus]|uniref:hypothetical protein n=1 Tax=Streptomyces hygroscopicus TaxID=1912 RepID=UPI00224002B5|nr:hypothetical protein [Streptomyces hygroscopicus]